MGDLHLGKLWLSDADQPWYYCKFEPTPAFETINRYSMLRTKRCEFDRAAELLEEAAARGVCLIWGERAGYTALRH
ncbi:MAG: hypothetical protein J2P54_26930, partial [Bradyrhizobiaceae bacterium]|nr:hypothetical protein [Bradyrhizobiaceae bacterium]